MQEEDMPNTQMDKYNKQKEHKDLTWFTNRISSQSKDKTFINGIFTKICLQEEHIKLLSISAASLI